MARLIVRSWPTPSSAACVALLKLFVLVRFWKMESGSGIHPAGCARTLGSNHAATVTGSVGWKTGPLGLCPICPFNPGTASSASPLESVAPLPMTVLSLVRVICKTAQGRPCDVALLMTEAWMTDQFGAVGAAGEGKTLMVWGENNDGTANGALTDAHLGRYRSAGSTIVTSNETADGQGFVVGTIES